eukprot:GHVT01089281.1.p2 GENE.GHVT01089281.1~~GHVT01089281.1.p2  ORF type:complete len:119 (-),score=13.19 GHVT01089281.1:1185-1541(-)
MADKDLASAPGRCKDVSDGMENQTSSASPGAEVNSERKGQITVHLRPRPTARRSEAVTLENDEGVISICVPKEIAAGFVNNTRTNYRYQFDGIFPMDATQEDVFQGITVDVLEDVLKG